MKRILMAIALVVVVAGGAHAVTTSNVYITVTLVAPLSISLDTSTYDDYIALGDVDAASVDNLAVPTSDRVVVVNDTAVGSAYYSLQITADPDAPQQWTATNALPAAEDYRLFALFRDAEPAVGVFLLADDVFPDETIQIIGDHDTFGDGTVGESGYDVAATESRNLWFKFDAPLSTQNTGEQTLTVTITIYSMP